MSHLLKHPLFTLDDDEFGELMTRCNPPEWQVGRFREARAGRETQELMTVLALWQSAIPQPDGFRWPWPTLDRQVGPLPTGDLAVVLAQTGSGKTTFTASLLNRLPKDTQALVFATEIPADRCMSALASRRAGLHPDRVQQGLWDSAG